MECELSEAEDAAAGISGRASAMAADLVVMGTHGRSGFRRLVLGSVTEKVLRQASAPVLTIPPGVADAVPVPAALFKQIVCAIDFSACSMRALDYAMSLVRAAEGQLTVVHVFELGADVYEVDGPTTVKEYIAAAEGEARKRLRSAIPEGVRADGRVDTILRSGSPYREILSVAAEQHADLIVVGVHGRSATDSLFFGSTAQHLVRQATSPVLTVRTG